jgi:stress-induced-phosphoprotein 1
MSSADEFKAIGNKHLQAKEFDLAIEAYTNAIKLDGTNHVYYSNRSAAYLEKGDAENAFSDGTKCVEVNPSWAKGYSRKGAALHSLKRYEEAADVFGSGLEVSPNDASLKSGLDSVMKDKNKVRPAGGGPGGAGGLFGPQMLAKLVGHPKFGPKLADPKFMAKLNGMQSNPQLLMSDPEMMEVLQVILGGAGGLGGENPMGGGAMDEDDDDVEDMNANPYPSPPTSSSIPKVPTPMEVEEPLTDAEKAIKTSKANAVAAKEKGNTFYKAKKFDDAVAAYDEAIALDPSNMMFLNNKAAVFIELKKINEAIELCNESLQVGKANKCSFQDNAKVYQRIAAAHLKNDDIPQAIENYRKAQMEHPDKAIERKIKLMELEFKKQEKLRYINPELALEAKERGNTSFRAGDFPQAIKEYEEAIKRDPNNAIYRNNLAGAFTKMMLFNDAKREVEKSIELDPKYVKAWAKKGDIEFFIKEYHKSMESYRTGLALEPENKLCKDGLKKVAAKINSTDTEEGQKERAAHAMADPEIQQILQDPIIRQVLQDFQENQAAAQKAMQNPDIAKKIEKLIASGILQTK